MNQPQQFFDGYGDLIEVSVTQGDVCIEAFLNPEESPEATVSLYFHPTPGGRETLRTLGQLLIDLSGRPALKNDDKTEAP